MQEIIESTEKLADAIEAHNWEMHEQIQELYGRIVLSPRDVQVLLGMSREGA